ncbi:hypothetical protein H489_0108275 [Curtobacterium flaccumfaciens UCD-AKU]|uniref:phage tail tape measure protein n=1 Tax=Curtobacterium flaccumfaciens TaxID=2035 RepID=UPI00037AF058|nr:phage tail tape measure protein [Curtobacterium flaccumfaciens]EYT64804.1 hypothetical protein H489_0108275 [Curtobacterium flaccumfaciens UCD-AKU]
MPNRTVKTSLVAEVSGYISGFDQAAKKTRELGSETEKLGQKRQAIVGVGAAMTAMGAVAAAAVGLAVAKYAEFDAAMSSVQAATHAASDEMGLLRDAAVDAGATTVFTATQAANGIEELSKAGVSTTDILGGGLAGALDLASAGELEVADAAQIAATAMTQFNQKGTEVPHIADLLSAGAGKAQGSVKDLAQALNQGGLVASQAGFSIEETTGTLAAFASAGLLGSDAGTSLKTAIIALQNPSDKARGIMKQYGIDVYDSSGKMLSFGGIAAQLQGKLGSLSDEQRNAALAQIFGNDAVRAANVLYAEGADGIAEWTGKVDDQGYAAETARLKLDNLKGDVEKLGGAFDTALIQSGSVANDSLRGLVQTATGAIDVFNSMPPGLQGAALGVAAVTAAVGLLGGGALLLVPKIAEAKLALTTLGITAQTTRTRLSTAATFLTGPWGVAIGGAVAAASLFISAQAQSAEYTVRLRDSLDQTTGAMTTNTRELVANALAAKTSIFGVEVSGSSAYDKAKRLGLSLDTVTKAAQGNTAAYKELLAVQDDIRSTDDNEYVTKKYGEGLSAASGDITELVQAVQKQRGEMKSATEQQQQLSEAHDKGSDSSDTAASSASSAAEAFQAEADKATDLATEISNLVSEFDKLNGANQDAISANASYQEALAGLSDQVADQRKNTEGYTTSLDENTAIGASNANMLSELANRAQEAAEKQYTVDQSTMSSKDAADKYASTLAKQRQKFIESATAAGFNAGEVKKLADRVFQLPSEKQIKILANTDQAKTALADFIRQYDGRVIRMNTINNVQQVVSGSGVTTQRAVQANGSVLDFYGEGGFSESHVAQIAAAGTMRVWAEPETGGEAYIPLAASKRTRSLAIWEETGRRLQAFADGDVRGGTPTYVPTPPQIVYAQSPNFAGSGGTTVFEPHFESSGNQRQDFDDAWFQFNTKIRGAR